MNVGNFVQKSEIEWMFEVTLKNAEKLTEMQWEHFFETFSRKFEIEFLYKSAPELDCDGGFGNYIKDVHIFIKKTLNFILNSSVDVNLKAVNFCLVIIKKAVSYKQEKNVRDQIKAFIQLVMEILMKSKIITPMSYSKSQLVDLANVVGHLYFICKFNGAILNFKTVVEIWKIVVGLIQNYIKCDDGNAEHWNIIVVRPLNFFLIEVRRSLEFVCRKQTLLKPLDQVEKYLRVSYFYLNILQKFLNQIMHKSSVCADDFLAMYTNAKLLPKHLEGTDIAVLVDNHVCVFLDDLFLCLYHRPDMIEAVKNCRKYKDPNVCNLLTENFLKAVNFDACPHFIDSQAKLFKTLFLESFKDPGILQDPTTYNKIIAQFSAVALLAINTEFLHFLRDNIFEANFWLGSASTDVILLYQRYQVLEYLIPEFEVWRALNEKFALFSSDVRQVHISRLLKNALQLCKQSANSTLKKTFFHDLNTKTTMDSKNYKLIMVLGLNEVFSGEELQIKTCRTIKVCLDLLTQFLNSQLEVNNYYELITLLKLLETLSSLPKEFLRTILNTVLSILEGDSTSFQSLNLLLSTIFSMLSKFTDDIETDSLYELVRNLEQSEIDIEPGLLKLIKDCVTKFTNQILKDKKFILNHKIITSNSKTFDINCLGDVHSSTTGHCTLCCTCEDEPESKRFCFDSD